MAATALLNASQPGAGAAIPASVVVDIYGFDRGCPDLNHRLKADGYRGSVLLSSRGASRILVRGDEPVILKSEWREPESHVVCYSAMALRPAASATYLFGYTAPLTATSTCGALVRRVNAGPDGHMEVSAVQSAVSVKVERSLWGLETEDRVCSLADMDVDDGGAQTVELSALPIHPSGIDLRSTSEESRAVAPPLPPALAGAAPAKPAAPADASTNPSPASEIIRKNSHGRARSEHTSGTGFGVRFGFAGGGDNLVAGQLSNGSTRTLDAGKGAIFSVGGLVTPVWIGETFGFGAAVEFGWKGGAVEASNGNISLNRFPLVGSIHALARLSRYSYLMMAGGVEKDFGVHMSGEGFGAGTSFDFGSNLGVMGEASLFYGCTRNLGLDWALRLTSLRYTSRDSSIDASSLGFTMAGFYLF